MVLLFAVAARLLLAPLFDAPGSTVVDARSLGSWLLTPNTDLFLWALSWDWHALTSSASLWDANVLQPMDESLRAVFPRLGHLLLFGPLLAVTDNPIAAHQLNLWANFALSGAAMYALARELGGSRAAALLAGFVYAFCAARVVAVLTPSLAAGQYLALGLIFLDRWSRRGGAAALAAAVLLLIWQAACGAIFVYAVPFFALVFAAATLSSASHSTGRALAVLFLVCLATGWMVAPIASGVADGAILVASETGGSRELGLLGSIGAWSDLVSQASRGPNPAAALATPARLGWAVLSLGLLGAYFAGGHRVVRVAMLAVAAVAACLARGPAGGPLAWSWRYLGDVFPAAATSLLPSHFVFLLVFAVAVFAAAGVDGLARWSGRPRLAWAIALACGVAFAWESGLLGGRSIKVVKRAVGPHGVYDLLDRQPEGAVLEIPFDTCRLDWQLAQAQAMLRSSGHWRPTLNGIGELEPRQRAELLAIIDALPDPRAIELLQRVAGLRHTILYAPAMAVDQRNAWLDLASARELGFVDAHLVIELEGLSDPELRRKFLALAQQRTTLLGTPVTPVPAAERLAAVRVEAAEVGMQGIPFRLQAEVENRSPRAWPVLGGNRRERVEIAYRWRGADGTPIGGEGRARLPFDLAPGASLKIPLCVDPPAVEGPVEIEVGVVQGAAGEDWFAGERGRAAIRLRRFRGVE